MSCFNNIVQLAKNFGTLATAIEDGDQLYNLVTGYGGGMSQVLSELNNIATEIQNGLNEVVNAVNNSTYQGRLAALRLPA